MKNQRPPFPLPHPRPSIPFPSSLVPCFLTQPVVVVVCVERRREGEKKKIEGEGGKRKGEKNGESERVIEMRDLGARWCKTETDKRRLEE